MFYGGLAERRGEKVVLFLSTIGYAAMQMIDVAICSVPLLLPSQTVWASSLFLFVGGGQRIFNSMIFALVSSQLDDENRTQYMYWLALGPHYMRFISPRIAATLMKIGLFAPFWLGLGSLGLIIAVVSSMPAKLVAKQSNSSPAYVRINDTDDSNNAIDETSPRDTHPLRTAALRTRSRDNHERCHNFSDYLREFHGTVQRRFHITAGLMKDPVVIFVYGAAFFKKIGFASSVFAFQYVSERFGWQLRDTTWLRVVSGIGAVVITVVAPLATAKLLKCGLPTSFIDLNVTRGALGMLSVSFIMTWKATSGSLVLASMFGIGLGEALEPALQGLIAQATDCSIAATVFTTYAFFDAAAELIAGPLTARLMGIGRTEDRPSDGLCFLVSSIVFGFLLLWTGPLRQGNRY